MTERCAICELELDPLDRQTIRLSSSQPPWRYRSAAANVVALIGESFAATLRAAVGEPDVTLWFHREPCWRGFLELLDARGLNLRD